MFTQQVIIVKHGDSSTDVYDNSLGKFSTKQLCTSGVDALQFLEQSPAHIAIIETESDDMNGIEIAESIRDIDAETGHFTYIILVGDEDAENVIQATVEFIDVHIEKTNEAMTKSVIAGIRISEQMNLLVAQNIQLAAENLTLQNGQLLDPLTGLGNRRMARHSLQDSIKQIESRGGAVCVLMIALDNYQEILETYDQKIADELTIAVANKIQHLVRPLDIVCYFDTGRFGLVLIQPSISHCTAECYQRIYDGVRLKSYNTAVGFLPANIAMSICASHAENGAPNPNLLFETAEKGLLDAAKNEQMYVQHLTPVE